jgi:hypothetical protein
MQLVQNLMLFHNWVQVVEVTSDPYASPKPIEEFLRFVGFCTSTYYFRSVLLSNPLNSCLHLFLSREKEQVLCASWSHQYLIVCWIC